MLNPLHQTAAKGRAGKIKEKGKEVSRQTSLLGFAKKVAVESQPPRNGSAESTGSKVKKGSSLSREASAAGVTPPAKSNSPTERSPSPLPLEGGEGDDDDEEELEETQLDGEETVGGSEGDRLGSPDWEIGDEEDVEMAA